ncbi:MAG TPA: tetratricopeptide repeat protein [Terriglobales bacterium]|nr:tetratricopeptide repeat protein [Terriglobales bacterium]
MPPLSRIRGWKRLTTLFALVAAAALLGAALPVLAGDQQPAPPPPSKPEKVTLPHRYEYRFGDNPFLPSQALSATGTFIPAKKFPTAQWCAKCHQEVHQQWRESAHGNSFRPPWYLKNVQMLIDTKGIEYTRHCEGCHNPIALFSGALTKAAKVDRGFDTDGITCMVCHSIERLQNTSGTGSYVMGVPAVMLNEDGSPREKVDYDDILARPDLHKRAVMKDFYRTSEFCAACHKAAVPKILNDYKWQRAFSVYDEWQQSSWSRQSPLPFYKKTEVSTCQTCHMKPGDVGDYAAAGIAGKKQAASHRFLGANTAIPTLFEFPDQLRALTKFLQDDLFGIDVFAIQKNGTPVQTIAPLGTESFRLAAGDDLTVALVIQNKKIGHSYVPEQRDFYESWVQFKATDAAGKTIYESGSLKPDGFLDERAHSFTNRLISRDGKLLDRHQVWETRARAYDNTILPGRSQLVRYRFRLPESAQGPITVTATIRYRRFRRGYNNFILGKSVDYPVIDVASKSVTWNLGENAAAPAAADPMLRWNNYGIALLDQQQYLDAADAFGRVTVLKPDYADGWINLAIANISYQNYVGGQMALQRALALEPENARARYYYAMIDQAQGRLDAAAEKLRAVIAAYPRLRQARADLGFVYYQQNKFQLAREQYEALQTIDPDDLSAHYNLARIYRRLGMKKEAAVQNAYFNDRRDDPSAQSQAETWLRSHPEVSLETVPFHLHLAPSETPQTAVADQPKK